MENGVLRGDEVDDYVAPKAESFDYLFKVILVGDSGVGKTCVLTRFKERSLTNSVVEVTGGIVFKHATFRVDSKVVKLQVWDSAGQERFRTVTKIHFKNKDAYLLFYDVTKRLSFESVQTWLSDVKSFTENKAIILLVANKSENESAREVTREEGERIATESKVSYIEASAVSGANIDLIFEIAARTLIAKKVAIKLL